MMPTKVNDVPWVYAHNLGAKRVKTESNIDKELVLNVTLGKLASVPVERSEGKRR